MGLAGRLHAFRCKLKAKASAKTDHRRDNGRIVKVLLKVLHKVPIYLEVIDWKPLEVSERRIARSEIIQRDVHPMVAKGLQSRGNRLNASIQQNLLGDLDLNILCGNLRPVENAKEVVIEPGLGELRMGQIDSNSPKLRPLLSQLRISAAIVPIKRLPTKVASSTSSKAAPKVLGVQKTLRRMMPPSKRFEAHDGTRGEAYFRLVIGDDLILRNRLPNLAPERDPLHGGGSHLRCVHRHAIASLSLRPVERYVRILQQFRRLSGMIRVHSHANARSACEALSRIGERLAQALDHALGKRHSLLKRGQVCEQDGELITPEPRRCAVACDQTRSSSRGFLQQSIASIVAE